MRRHQLRRRAPRSATAAFERCCKVGVAPAFVVRGGAGRGGGLGRELGGQRRAGGGEGRARGARARLPYLWVLPFDVALKRWRRAGQGDAFSSCRVAGGSKERKRAMRTGGARSQEITRAEGEVVTAMSGAASAKSGSETVGPLPSL